MLLLIQNRDEFTCAQGLSVHKQRNRADFANVSIVKMRLDVAPDAKWVAIQVVHLALAELTLKSNRELELNVAQFVSEHREDAVLESLHRHHTVAAYVHFGQKRCQRLVRMNLDPIYHDRVGDILQKDL